MNAHERNAAAKAHGHESANHPLNCICVRCEDSRKQTAQPGDVPSLGPVCERLDRYADAMGFETPPRMGRESRLTEAAMAVADAEQAELRADWRKVTTALGYGDGITEPQIDVDNFIALMEEHIRDANEWRESQLWRGDCYAAGHPDDGDCFEHDPSLRLEKAEAQVARLLEAPFMCDTHMCGSCKGCRAANVRDWVTETETRASKVEAKLSAVRHIATDVLAEPNEALNDILDIIDGRRP